MTQIVEFLVLLIITVLKIILHYVILHMLMFNAKNVYPNCSI